MRANGLTLAYFDGNTVTGLWNYAQHYAMSDNDFETTLGDSTLGAIHLVSGQTNGIVDLINQDDEEIDGGHGSHRFRWDTEVIQPQRSTAKRVRPEQ